MSSLNYIQSNAVVTLPNQAAITIYASDSGKTLLVPAQGVASVVTMPALQAGLRYRFLVTALLGFTFTITPTAGTVTGTCLLLIPGAAAACIISTVIKAANNTIVIGAAATAGTYLDMNCDGNIWYISGVSTTAVGFA